MWFLQTDDLMYVADSVALCRAAGTYQNSQQVVTSYDIARFKPLINWPTI